MAPDLVLPPLDDESSSLDLAIRATAVARRIADLLERTCSEESGAPSAVQFLRSYADALVATAPAETPAGRPLDHLSERFGLSAAEQALVLLAGLSEEHEGLASTFRALHPRGEPRPTVGLAAQLLASSQREREQLRRLLTEGPATRFGLLRVAEDGTYYERSMLLADRLWEALHGHAAAWPASLPRVPLVPTPPGLEAWVELPEVRRGRDALHSAEDRTLLIAAAEESVAASRVSAMVGAEGLGAVGARVDRLDEAIIGLVVAHAAARGAVPVVFLDCVADGTNSSMELALGAVPGAVMVCPIGGAVRPTGLRPVVTVPVGPITTQARRRAWQRSLPDLAPHADTLAAQHPLDPAATSVVAADVRSRQRLAGGLQDVREIAEVIRARAGVTLPAGVDLESPDVAWSRLVLPDDAIEQLADAVSRLAYQATVLDDWGFIDEARADRGTRLMFTGPPGTGKSLAAEVVATAAGTDLLVVDVSQVVSKWIGETEKNLACIFDVAERTQAVLLLDEADALFGTRTEISDAHDRYANLQTAYLLQRLDHFDGLTVLATNLKQNIDPAFVRRMDFVIDFPLPDAGLRRRLWDLHLPSRAPVADVELDLLAALFPVPGAWIRNAAIAAGFLAANEDHPIGQDHVLKAMRREYDKASRPFPAVAALPTAEVGAR